MVRKKSTRTSFLIILPDNYLVYFIIFRIQSLQQKSAAGSSYLFSNILALVPSNYLTIVIFYI